MLKKDIIIKFVIIILIFSVGFFLRVESVNINGITASEKAYYQDQNGLPYMIEPDSYYNYRLTQNYLNHGYLGDTIINGTEWDLHSYYPGVPMDYPPLIIYLTALIYKFINLFSQIHLLTVCFWLPAFIGPLCGIIAYFFVSRLTNEYGGLTAGILAVIAPFYFMRTVPGWFDTDMFNFIFPILVVWLFIEALESKNNKMQILFAILSAFFMFLFSTAWNGWQYIFYVIVFSCIFYIIWSKFKGRNVKKVSYIFGIFLLGTIALILLFTGFINIIRAFNLFEFAKLFGHQNSWSIWPNSYISVSELRIPSIYELLDRLGLTILILGILGLFAVIILKKRVKIHISDENRGIYSLLMVLWTITSFFALIEGIRFIILIIPPLVISSGLILGIGTDYLKKYLIKRKKDHLIKIACIFAVFIVVFPAILNVNEFIYSTSIINDDIWNAAEWINYNTDLNTVVVSDWSYGHLLTGVAHRPVLYDGRMGYIETLPIRKYSTSYVYGDESPSISREYWIDRSLSTSNESLSLGILTMLSTNGDLGYLTLNNYTKNTTRSVEILNNILGVNKPTAEKILKNKYHLKENESLSVLKYTHPDNPNSFVIFTSNDMLKLGYWIFNFGEWIFNQKKALNHTYSVGNININKTILNTTNNITMNLNTNEIRWNNNVPYSYTVIKGNSVIENYLDKNSTFSIFLLMNDKKVVVIDKKFKNSIFTKLFIERSNSTIYKSIYKNKKIDVWKV